MSGPLTVPQAEAIFNTADALAEEATYQVGEVRKQVATGKATEGQLNKALKAEKTANERRLTAQAGVDVAREAQAAEDLAESQRTAALRAALAREALVVYMRRCRDTSALLDETENKLTRLGEDFDGVRPLVGNGNALWPTGHSGWTGMLRNVAQLRDWLAWEERRRAALGDAAAPQSAQRQSNERLERVQAETVQAVRGMLADMAALAKEYAEIEAGIAGGRTAGVFPTHLPFWPEAIAALNRIVELTPAPRP